MITLDKNKPFSEIFSTDPDDRTRYVQDGVRFDAACHVIGDAVEIARAKKEEAVRKARAELTRREAELNAEAESLGLSTQAVNVEAIRAEVEAKVRAELAAELEAKARAELVALAAKAEADAKAELAAEAKVVPTPPVAPKTTSKKPGPQAGASSNAA
jgi:hypothetical protein